MVLAVLTAALIATATSAQVTLVHDTFSDSDRIGGFDGSSTTASEPSIGTATATNTQWVANRTSVLVASAGGMQWTLDTTSNAMLLGYFPTVSLALDTPTTFRLAFTTGNMGGTTNNLRIGLLNGTPNGFRATDGFGSTDASYTGDEGYGVWSASSTVGGGNTSNLVLRTYQRNTLGTNLLGTAGEWGNNDGATQFGNSVGATGYFEANTSYVLEMTLTFDGTALLFETSLTGGNFVGMNYAVSDDVDPTTEFNMIAFRLGGGSNQFDSINFTEFSVSAIPEPSTYAALFGALALGLVAFRRRQLAQRS